MLSVTGDPLLDGKNIPNGATGYIYFLFSDGDKINGMFVTKDEFKNDHNKNAFGILGTTQKVNKKTSSQGTFSIEGYDTVNKWTELDYLYQTQGIDEYFTCIVVEHDPTTELGTKKTAYYNCNVDSVVHSQQNVDDEVKKLSISGTYDSFEPLQSYNEIPGLKMTRNDVI